ncbi:MAG: hypothetical protein RIE32_04495 [Phycisphaerales bacterium]
MTGTPLDLLSLVGLGSRLLGLGGADKAPDEGFHAALEAAREGDLEGGRAVVSGPELGVDLSADQLRRLSHAADVAEAQGASTAAVLIDGMVIKLDVESRTALESTPAESALMTDVDVVLSAGPTGEAGPDGSVLLRQLAPSGAPLQQV